MEEHAPEDSLAPLVRLRIRLLDPSCRPCRMRRRYGVTMVAIDPRASRCEITAWMVDNLTPLEQNIARSAFGLHAVEELVPLEEWMVDDDPCFLYVPPGLRTKGAPALQGGSELARRRRLGLLGREMEAYRQELSASLRPGASAPRTLG